MALAKLIFDDTLNHHTVDNILVYLHHELGVIVGKKRLLDVHELTGDINETIYELCPQSVKTTFGLLCTYVSSCNQHPSKQAQFQYLIQLGYQFSIAKKTVELKRIADGCAHYEII